MAVVCSLCHRGVPVLTHLIQGPSINMCPECVEAGRAACAGQAIQGWAPVSQAVCNFCSRETAQVRHFIEKTGAEIDLCKKCLDACQETFENAPSCRIK
ncbi:MAG: hypothetical protein GKR89_22285 [Candidatus Latescibacteria bacterium]|nr:hypothetical protein [Candidatus Latescibacterota bacterium]